ncbi:uncharacterized protein LOC131065652 isoform X2 [Cryptomeria japonica]|uniref:uncharacterized protein LOC131065652 isoform X2 n=1 Tax=Cryptomeria japonica TaxID=3369 RepID=UPI0025AC747D|nr:uncharacterized protein LOC131065652 isoform X2 [Cryptomeria japonica]
MSSSLESRSQGSKCDGTPLSSIEDIQRRLIPPNPTQNTNYSVSLRICAPSPRLARIKRGINNIDAEEVNTTVLLEDYLDSSLLSIAVSKYAASESILGKSKIIQSFEWPTEQLEPMNSIEIAVNGNAVVNGKAAAVKIMT